jgi:acyl-CoA synthetase (NDP forming)
VTPRSLLAPERIALVGASTDPCKATSRPLTFLRESRFAGEVYPVNPHHEVIGGERAYPSLQELPAVPDHALLMTSADGVVHAVRDCAELGVPVATILAGGFAEQGPDGLARQQELVRIAREGGVRVLGPNSLGVVNLRADLRLTGNAVFAEPDLPVGGTFVASQSGSMIGSLVSRGKARGLGFSTVISVGGEADLSIGEICAASLNDSGVTGYLLFLETIRRADALAQFAKAAAVRGKPVVAYKLGRSKVGAGLAVSHTGALAGEDDVAGEFLADYGIARVDSLEGLLETAPLAARTPTRSHTQPVVGVVTTTGGGAAIVVDQLGVRGVHVVPPSAQTYQRLAEAGVAVGHGHIVDLTLAGTRYAVMKSALEVLLTAPEFDLMVAVVGSSARQQPELAVAPIIDTAGATATAVPATFLVPDAPQALQQLAAAGIPAFRTPESCADAVAATLSRRRPVARERHERPEAERPTRLLDEDEAHEVIEKAGVPVAEHAVLDADAHVPDLPFSGPFAVKVLDAALPHKSDVGGVVLNVPDQTSVAEAIDTLVARVKQHRPEQPVRRVLVQPMLSGQGEVLLAYRVDPQVGPIVVLAAGGTLTELYRDRAVRLAPVTKKIAQEMLEEVIALRTLRGYRGTPPGDLGALAAAVNRMSLLAQDGDIAEAEINPLLVHGEAVGVTAVDALVRVHTRKKYR